MKAEPIDELAQRARFLQVKLRDYDEVMANLRQRIVELETDRSWISVKDRLPEIPEDEFECNSELVLTLTADGTFNVGGRTDWGDGDGPYWWTMRYGGTTCRDVTHWTPLPEMP